MALNLSGPLPGTCIFSRLEQPVNAVLSLSSAFSASNSLMRPVAVHVLLTILGLAQFGMF